MTVERPAVLVLVRHAESARNVAKKGNTFFLDDESRKAVQGIADHHVPITDEGHRQAELTGRALRAEFGAFDYVYPLRLSSNARDRRAPARRLHCRGA
jgi:broad specificity phosphatase PhoE